MIFGTPRPLRLQSLAPFAFRFLARFADAVHSLAHERSKASPGAIAAFRTQGFKIRSGLQRFLQRQQRFFFDAGNIAAADAQLFGNLPLGMEIVSVQAVAQHDNLFFAGFLHVIQMSV